MSEASELRQSLWFVGVVGALVVLFAAGLRLRVPPPGLGRWLSRLAILVAGLAVVILANMALFRHDAHLDLTREQAFTPSAETEAVVRGLTRDVELLYFFQKQNPAGRLARTLVETMGRMSPRLSVRTVDADQQPALASRYGVRVYNTAVLLSGERRVEVVTTDDRDLGLALLRVTRAQDKTICFAAGHGEYDIDNYEFHTHFEGQHAHSHNVQGMAVVMTEQHGVGRLRRALEKLGLGARKATLATLGGVPDDCAALVDPNPRTAWTPSEVDLLRDYLQRGGAALLLFEPDVPVEGRLAALLGAAGMRVGDGLIVDPREHYFTDEQMVAVTQYARHPAVGGLALSFLPGARPLEAVPAPSVITIPLFSSSKDSYTLAPGPRATRAPAGMPAAHPLALAAEGRWSEGKRFRLIVVGDADFASNSFFPYMSNADLVLGMLAWLIGEERAPTMKPPIEVLPTVTLTGAQVRGILIVTVLLLPGMVALVGGGVWWRRRR